MDDVLKKTERLIEIWIILRNSPLRFTTRNLAERFGVNVKTIYRDLDTLDVELRVPIQKQGTKWGIDESYFLPPIRFSVPEALNIFLAARLMLNYSHRYDPTIEATFIKLKAVLPPPLSKQVQKTLDWMEKQPRNERYLSTLAKLAEAWVSQKRAKITYRSLPAEKATGRIIEPYFIEPAAAGHASYVIAYCRYKKTVRIFKIERIESIEVTSEPYEIPPDFDANEYFSPALGIVVEGEAQTIKLRVSDPQLVRIMEETIWHPSQRVERQSDGSATMTLEVSDTVELYSWILGWGEMVEVLEPAAVRQGIIETAEAMLDIYKAK